MAKKKQEQEEVKDGHVMAVLDKRTNKTAVVSKMNENDGSIEVVSRTILDSTYHIAGAFLLQF